MTDLREEFRLPEEVPQNAWRKRGEVDALSELDAIDAEVLALIEARGHAPPRALLRPTAEQVTRRRLYVNYGAA